MDKLYFNVSSGLKNLIGQELITNKHIAIFELVKNSYDASASNVKIEYINNKDVNSKIIIEDDGIGMDLDDIKTKWLFVAYSDKKDRGTEKRSFAGAKGVGRFSCDRLGAKLIMYTKTKKESEINKLTVYWGDFEKNNLKKFSEIEILHEQIENNGMLKKNQGTIIEIIDLRDIWDRKEILILKKSLRRLINPLEDKSKDPFKIEIIANAEKKDDYKIDDINEIVNGVIVNDLFDNIFESTVCIDVEINENGDFIDTTLYDRGEFIYKIKELNPYGLLKNINAKIYYLNRSAKIKFNKIMGIASVDYGSIFVYKNNFRVMRYGEPKIDFFGIDSRKSQGYNRYLGTREIVGYIQIKGENIGFKESTSRDGGFLENNHTNELEEFYITSVQRKLEKYVVDIIKFAQPLKDDPDVILTPEDVAEETVKYINKGKFIEIKINENLLNIIDDRQSKSALKQIDELSSKYRYDPNIQKQLEVVKKSTEDILKAKFESEKELEKQEKKISKLAGKIRIEEEANLFLRNTIDRKVKDVILLIHQIKIDSGNIRTNIVDCIRNINNLDYLYDRLASITRLAARIQANSRIIEKGNFDVQSRKISDNLVQFIKTYIEQRYKGDTSIKFDFVEEISNINLKYEPSQLMSVIDNIVDNSLKHKADNLIISFQENDNYHLIKFKDNGSGLSEGVDINKLGNLGYSSTNGSGIGIFNIKNWIKAMRGEISFKSENGFEIMISFRK